MFFFENFTEVNGVLHKIYVHKEIYHLATVIPHYLGLSMIIKVHAELAHPGENKTLFFTTNQSTLARYAEGGT